MTTIKYLKSNGRKYKFEGLPGAVLKSRERGVKPGDVRHIENKLFFAYRIGGGSWAWALRTLIGVCMAAAIKPLSNHGREVCETVFLSRRSE